MRFITNLVLFCVSSLLMVAIAEVALRHYLPDNPFSAAWELGWMRNNKNIKQSFTIDPEFGFRPIFCESCPYTSYGTLKNTYSLEKNPSKTRILFLGDSTTARPALIDSLRSLWGDDRYEYWNAGVESFNTVQEVSYYFAYNKAINPDRVVLVFNMTDFETTPVVFIDGNNDMVVYAPHAPLRRVSRWLFGISYVYRWFLGVTISRQAAQFATLQEIEGQLVLLRDELNARHIPFSVIVIPFLAPLSALPADDANKRDIILKLLTELNIKHFDLYSTTSELLDRHAPIQIDPIDIVHFNDVASNAYAKYLYDQDFLPR